LFVISNTSQLLIVIQGITVSLEVVEEPASVKSLHGTTGEDLSLTVCETMKELELPWTKMEGWQQTGL